MTEERNEDVVLELPEEELFIGSHIKVPVTINLSSGLQIGDLEFNIPAGPEGGIVSLSRDKDFSPTQPDIMLCVGYKPGSYVLQALKKGTTTIVAESKFVVTDVWKDDLVGPSKWFTGITELYTFGSAWGGGSASPQNINIRPATGTRRIAILLVDTSSQRFTNNAAELQGHRDRWLNETVNGVVTGGVRRSSAHYYREVSYGIFNLSAQVFGPVQLSGSWDDYFNPDGSFKAGYFEACASAGDSLINYNNFDTLLCVSQSVDATPTTPQKSAWPYAFGVQFNSNEGFKHLAAISMPNEWGINDNREIYETLSHEIGHNIGLFDMYVPNVPGRNLGSWDLMDWDDPLPHFCIGHRMMLGWVPANQIKTYNFATTGAPVDDTVTLHPIEQATPPAGRYSGIEIRIADGWNYYFEYRVRQAAHIGDRNLPTNNCVLGTDLDSPPVVAPIARPEIVLLNTDEDGDGNVLGNGQDYKETDRTTPSFPTPLVVGVSGIDGTKADVRIRYGINGKPDPLIRPWPAGPGREWQSPDIEVQNPRNLGDPVWFNVPWEGHENTVIASVRNGGNLNAPRVRVEFYVCDFTVSGSSTPDTFLGVDVRDIAAGATVQFTTRWTPPRQRHYCIKVIIPLYQTPGSPSVAEMTELNNLAQSNYTRFISRTSSAATREVTTVEVVNPYDKPTRIFITGGQTNPLYRSFIQHSFLKLDAHERKKVKIMFEYAGDTSGGPPLSGPESEEYPKKHNNVGLAVFIEDPRDKPSHAVEALGGAQIQVATGRSTEFEEFNVDEDGFRGTIVTSDDHKRVRNGKVILVITLKEGEREYVTVQLSEGKFSRAPTREWQSIRAYYIPTTAGYADSESKRIYNDNAFK